MHLLIVAILHFGFVSTPSEQLDNLKKLGARNRLQAVIRAQDLLEAEKN